MTVQPCPKKDVPVVLALSFTPSRRAARTGPIKAGGLLYVLDHSRWTQQMRYAIDPLMAKHHGQKDFLAKVDVEYAAVIQAASRDPNSLLHPTTKQHISRYVKHLAKMTNTSSSLNTRESLKLLSSAPQPQSRLGRNEKQERLRRNIPLGSCADSATGLSIKDQTVHTSTQVFLVWLENIFIVLLWFFSLYQAEGMTREMTWADFCQSSFYEAEKRRWAVEKGK
ncbi:hypothetical protein AMECASPLE_028887 [Ameca splendens]|uniref:Uncharacterized protein n=1 Tax=Ameca splendens TaxID=208324 RepID=A0ABV1AEI3_9TELE